MSQMSAVFPSIVSRSRVLRALVATGLVIGVVVAVGTAKASTPASGTVTVPSTVGQTVTETYTGTLTITTVAPGTGADINKNNGTTFDHANLNDPARMVGEPDIEIDNHNGIYVSGPGGSTTQASWFWKSTDNGIQWHTVGVLP